MTARVPSFLGKVHNGHVLGIAAGLAVPACVFSVPFIAPLLIATALAALAVDRLNARRWAAPPRDIAVILGLLVLYGLASTLWAVSAPLGILLAIRLLGIFAAGLILFDAARMLGAAERATFARLFLAGLLVGVVLIEVESATRAQLLAHLRSESWVVALIGAERPLYFFAYFDRVATLLTLLTWPAAAILLHRFGWPWALGLALFTALAVLIANSETARFSYVGAAIVFAAARWRPRRAAAVVAGLIALGLVVAPVALRSDVVGWVSRSALLPVSKEGSFAHRVAIWNFVIGKIGEKPILGWGLNSARVMPGGHAKYEGTAEILPLHPHDAALQIWVELGVPGVLLGVAFVVALCRRIASLRPWPIDQALALATVAAAAINASSGYDVWHPWWLFFLCLAAACAAATLGPAAGPDEPRSAPTGSA